MFNTSVKINGKATLALSLVVIVNLVLYSIFTLHWQSQPVVKIPKVVTDIQASNVSRLFKYSDKVLSVSSCQPSAVREVKQVVPHTQLFFLSQECQYVGNTELQTVSLRDDLSHIDAIFIDVEYVGKDNLLDTLKRFHNKPTKYILVYWKYLTKSVWVDDFAFMNEVGDILDDFMETHVRWQIHFEPFEHKEKFKLENRVFLLRGENSEAWDLIQQHQFPVDCKAKNYFVAEYWTFGWGSYVEATFRSLEASTQYNKTLLLTSYWTTYAKHSELGPRASQFCDNSLPDCYYLKLTNCTLGDALDSLHRAYGLVSDWQNTALNRDLSKDPVVFVRGHPYDVTHKYWTRGYIQSLTRWIDDETGPYFFQFMRNRRYVREVIYDRITSIDLHSKAYIGLHIRHGDKHNEAGAYRHLSYYVQQAKNITKRLCTKKEECPFDLTKPIPMFVMTDDATELDNAEFPGVELVYFQTTRHQGEVGAMFTEEQNRNRTETF